LAALNSPSRRVTSSFALVNAACAESTLACAAATGSAGLKGDVNEEKKFIILLNYFSFLCSLGANLGKVVGAEDANRIDDDGEGNHELNGGGQELAGLEGDTTDDHDGFRQALASERGEERGDDAVRECGKESRHH
jgi:hypothetical protein